MKTDHNLIDRENPKCLYCNGQCNVSFTGEKGPLGYTYDDEILTCTLCGENFTIYCVQNPEGETSYYAFSFSCKDIIINYHYGRENFLISFKNNKSTIGHVKDDVVIRIPPFEVNFADKNKLYDKLKIYILFS